jgi:hypothetical protein
MHIPFISHPSLTDVSDRVLQRVEALHCSGANKLSLLFDF